MIKNVSEFYRPVHPQGVEQQGEASSYSDRYYYFTLFKILNCSYLNPQVFTFFPILLLLPLGVRVVASG